ncbi:hypothetical protein ACIQ6R_16250 [Streptomyces sp. NPDC096048]|uniref:hypothetical protein n=1 Tax=Streptomyces sp. NPDC096048 TaxID=3366072 RepID=UPI003803286F
MTAVSLPMPIVVTRHQCPFCRRTWAKKAAAAAHIARCWQNPNVRACKTCVHYEPPSEGPYPQHPGWSEDCGAGELLADLPNANCPSWQKHTTEETTA